MALSPSPSPKRRRMTFSSRRESVLAAWATGELKALKKALSDKDVKKAAEVLKKASWFFAQITRNALSTEFRYCS